MQVARAASMPFDGRATTDSAAGPSGPSGHGGTTPEDRRRAALMAAALAGDRIAYERLLRESMSLVRRLCRSHAMADDRVDDVIQETLLTMHRIRRTFDPTRSFDAWLTAIARRRMVDVWRSSARILRREMHDEAAYESFADPSTDHAERNAPLLREGLQTAIASLPPAQRQAVEHLGLLGEAAAEASRATGRSVGSLRVNLHRALAALRAQLGGGS